MRAAISRMHPSQTRKGDTRGSRLTEFQFPDFRLSGRLLSALFNYPLCAHPQVYNILSSRYLAHFSRPFRNILRLYSGV